MDSKGFPEWGIFAFPNTRMAMAMGDVLCAAMVFSLGRLTIFAGQPVYFQIALLEVSSSYLASVFTTSTDGH